MTQKVISVFNTPAKYIYGYSPLDYQGALVPPVFQTSTFAFPTAQYGADCFAGKEKGHFILVYLTLHWIY